MKKHSLHALFFIVAVFGFSALTMLLWNAILPSVLGTGTIGFFQAAGLLILGRLLFGGLGAMHFLSGHSHRRGGHMHERFSNMSMDDRRRVMKRMMEAHENLFNREEGDRRKDVKNGNE